MTTQTQETLRDQEEALRLDEVQEALAEGEPEAALAALDAPPPLKSAEAELARARCHVLIAEDYAQVLDALRRAGEAGASASEVLARYEPLTAMRLPTGPRVRLLSWLSERVDDPELAVSLAKLQVRRQDHAGAEAAARRVLTLDRDHVEGWRMLLVAVMGSPRPERGLEVVREALRTTKVNPRFPVLKALLAGLDPQDAQALATEMSETWNDRSATALIGAGGTVKGLWLKAGGAYSAALRGETDQALERARAHLAAREEAGQTPSVMDVSLPDVLPLVPGPEAQGRPLLKDDGSEVLRSGPSRSGVTMLVFTNLVHDAIYPVQVVDAFAAAAGAATLVLRDYSYRLFIGGVPSMAPDRAGTVMALRNELMALRTKRLLVVGVSSGACSAITYGRELNAARILGLGAPSSVGRFMRGEDRRARMLIAKLARSFPPTELDVATKLEEVGGDAPVELYYGDRNEADTGHAEELSEIPGTTLRPIEGLIHHQVLPEMILQGAFQRWLEDPSRTDM
ncbi:MAG: tetratricopeptide repeat protein [Hasllibacter sp.]